MRERGIKHEVSLIFGLPEQTYESFMQSVAWCLDRNVPVIKAFPLMLLRGTELERDRARWSLRENDSVMPVVVASNSFGECDWRRMAGVAEALRCTEDQHPTTRRELEQLAKRCVLEPGRWTP